MIRRIFSGAVAVAMLLAVSDPVRAQGTGHIRVIPTCCGSAVTGGKVTVSRAGIWDGTGYRLTDGLADWTLWQGELQAREVILWLMEQELTEVGTKPVTEDGALFSDLEAGVYLVEQSVAAEGYLSFSPFLAVVEEGALEEVRKYPVVLRNEQSPETADRPAPIIGAMGLGFAITLLLILADRHRK